jgi:KUP system potassium uptake protein
MTLPSEPQSPASDHVTAHKSSLVALVIGSIGVVYGDIGTSPLYALRESLVGASEGGLTDNEIIGIVSLLLWTLILIVSVKYVALILRADNRGEGGTLSLVALARSALERRAGLILGIGVLGMSLFFGDAIITPAISVLSAVEGLKLVTPALDPFVVPIALVIIAAIFWVQHKGTERVSTFFGPITLGWFLVLGVLGAMHIGDELSILHAVNPVNAIWFLVVHGATSLPVMGSVFLAVTGAEALYADMGHFGRKPIRIAWNAIVFPALMLSYLGQGALVLSDRAAVENPFFLLAPDWFLLPLVILATAATVIASQAVISGAYSMARQAVQMGLMPRLEVQHTSESQFGQIFMPQVNRILFVGVVALVLSFGSSTNLASAYGIAVTGDMVITTLLAMIVFRYVWGWRPVHVALVCVPLLAIELMFLVANLAKVMQGGWVPLVFAMTLGLMVWTWIRGTAYVQRKARAGAVTLEKLTEMLTPRPPLPR